MGVFSTSRQVAPTAASSLATASTRRGNDAKSAQFDSSEGPARPSTRCSVRRRSVVPLCPHPQIKIGPRGPSSDERVVPTRPAIATYPNIPWPCAGSEGSEGNGRASQRSTTKDALVFGFSLVVSTPWVPPTLPLVGPGRPTVHMSPSPGRVPRTGPPFLAPRAAGAVCLW